MKLPFFSWIIFMLINFDCVNIFNCCFNSSCNNLTNSFKIHEIFVYNAEGNEDHFGILDTLFEYQHLHNCAIIVLCYPELPLRCLHHRLAIIIWKFLPEVIVF